MGSEDERMDRQREAILAQCPYLRSFLERDTRITPSPWQPEYSKQSAAINEELQERFGESWYNTVIMPQFIWFWELQILDPARDEQWQREKLQMLFKFGYELGGIENSKTLYPEIINQIKKENYVNSKLFETREGRAISIYAIRSVLKSGEFLKTHPAVPLQSDIPLSIQKAFGGYEPRELDPTS